MTSANKEPEKFETNESQKNRDKEQSEGEVALDPNPSKALTELATGSENTTPKDDQSSTST